MPLWFEKDSHQGLTVAGSIGVAQSRISRAQRLTPLVFGLVAGRAERLWPPVPFSHNMKRSGYGEDRDNNEQNQRDIHNK